MDSRQHIFARRPLLALALGLGLFLVLRHSTRAPAWRQHEFYTSKAKILIKTNGPVVRLGYGRFDMDERDDPVLRRWFLDLSAVDKFIKRPEFLERVSALCDVPVSELSSVSAFPVVVVARHDVLYGFGTSSDQLSDFMAVARLEGDEEGAFGVLQDLEGQAYRRGEARTTARFIQFSTMAGTPEKARKQTEALIEVFQDEARHILAGDVIEEARAQRDLSQALADKLEQRKEALKIVLGESLGDDEVRETELTRLEHERARLRSIAAGLQVRVSGETGWVGRVAVGPVQQALQSRQLDLASAEELYLPESQVLEELRHSVEGLSSLDKSLREEDQMAYREGLETRLRGLEGRVAELDTEIATLEATRPSVPAREAARRLRTEIASLEAAHSQAQIAFFQAKLAEAKVLERGSFIVVEEPLDGTRFRPPAAVRNPDRGNLLGLLAASLCFAFMGTVIWETLLLRSSFLSRVEKFLDVEVVGVLPPQSRRARRLWDEWKSKVGRESEKHDES